MSVQLPILLPSSSILPEISASHWTPKKYLEPPQAPPIDDARMQDQAMTVARHLMDGKALKKTRPRRTVDYGGSMGRYILNRKLRPNSRYVPYMRPAPPYIVDLLPPIAYPNNLSMSLCTKFVHTSTNKIRCPVNCVAWTPEGRRVLTGSTSGEFTLWNGLTFNFETILQAHDTAIRSLTFTHAGSFLVSADQSGTVKYFQLNMNNLTEWNAHREAVRDISFSPDDSRFATASDDSTVRIWSFEERREEKVLTGHGWDVRCVQWHPTKGLLVSGSKDNLIKFWDPRTATCLSTLHQHKNTVQALAWSPDGNFVASASRDQTVRVFDIRAMKEFRILRGHKKEACSLAWHPIHPILVSGGSEGSLLHWDLYASDNNPGSSANIAGTGAGPRATLSQAHDSNVWSLAFHPLGHILASASNDHTTRFWSRERPGDVTSVFSGGGEKPPAAADISGQDEEDDMVPGFSFFNEAGGATGVQQLQQQQQQQQWEWQEEEELPGLAPEAVYNAGNMDFKPIVSAGLPGLGLDLSGSTDEGIPGLGGNEDSPSRQPAQAPPSQEKLWAQVAGSYQNASGYQNQFSSNDRSRGSGRSRRGQWRGGRH